MCVDRCPRGRGSDLYRISIVAVLTGSDHIKSIGSDSSKNVYLFFFSKSRLQMAGKLESRSSHWVIGDKHTVDMEGLVFVLLLLSSRSLRPDNTLTTDKVTSQLTGRNSTIFFCFSKLFFFFRSKDTDPPSVFHLVIN